MGGAFLAIAGYQGMHFECDFFFIFQDSNFHSGPPIKVLLLMIRHQKNFFFNFISNLTFTVSVTSTHKLNSRQSFCIPSTESHCGAFFDWSMMYCVTLFILIRLRCYLSLSLSLSVCVCVCVCVKFLIYLDRTHSQSHCVMQPF